MEGRAGHWGFPTPFPGSRLAKMVRNGYIETGRPSRGPWEANVGGVGRASNENTLARRSVGGSLLNSVPEGSLNARFSLPSGTDLRKHFL